MTDHELRCRVADYMRLPYRKVIRGEPVEGFLGEVPELPGCLTAGETEMEALANLKEAMEVWLEAAILRGLPIPTPVPV